MKISLDTQLPPIFEKATGNPNAWQISADVETGNAIKFDDLTL